MLALPSPFIQPLLQLSLLPASLTPEPPFPLLLLVPQLSILTSLDMKVLLFMLMSPPQMLIGENYLPLMPQLKRTLGLPLGHSPLTKPMLELPELKIPPLLTTEVLNSVFSSLILITKPALSDSIPLLILMALTQA